MITNRIRMRKKSKGDTWDGIFADPEVGRVLHANGLIADANKSSIEELATITTLNPDGGYGTGYFSDNTVITKIPELQYCTGLSRLDYTFRGCINLTEVILPSSVTNMYNTFRECISLVDAPTIPEGVTNMGGTFNGCSSLISAPTIPEGVTNMQSTFTRCSSLLQAPVIPEGVKNLNSAFDGCSSLISAPTIPEGVTNMSYTFTYCRSLDGIFVIKPVTPPTYRDIFYDVNVKAIYVPDVSVDTYKSASGWSNFADKIYPMSEYWDDVFADPEVGRVLHANGLIVDPVKSSTRELATITSLNPSDTSTGSYFYNNKVITQFPELQYCTGLTSLYGAFYGCTNLTTVGDIPEGVTDLGVAFYGCSKLTTTPNIPEGVTSLNGTFDGCANLITTPVIPEGVTDLGAAFYGCSKLTTTPNIPEGVENLNDTFSKCSSLTTAPDIPSDITILYSTFSYCSSLLEAPVIPSSVTSLGFTFYRCSSIDGIYIINAVTPPSYNDSLSNVQAIYVPDESVSAYKLSDGWSDFADKIYPMSTKP